MGGKKSWLHFCHPSFCQPKRTKLVRRGRGGGNGGREMQKRAGGKRHPEIRRRHAETGKRHAEIWFWHAVFWYRPAFLPETSSFFPFRRNFLGKGRSFFRFRGSFLPERGLLFGFRHALARLRRGFLSFWPDWEGAGFPVSGASQTPGAGRVKSRAGGSPGSSLCSAAIFLSRANRSLASLRPCY